MGGRSGQKGMIRRPKKFQTDVKTSREHQSNARGIQKRRQRTQKQISGVWDDKMTARETSSDNERTEVRFSSMRRYRVNTEYRVYTVCTYSSCLRNRQNTDERKAEKL